jgi:hypothetical protein
MPVFTQTGLRQQDYLLVDGSKDFAILSAGVLKDYPQALPIRLHVGNAAFGLRHMNLRHASWYKKLGLNPVDLLWQKLQSRAIIYPAEATEKFKWSFRFNPSSLMIVEYRDDDDGYLSVVSLYSHPHALDGNPIAKYRPLVIPSLKSTKADTGSAFGFERRPR